MAEDLDDGEFWLPSQFLTDDDILMEKRNVNRTNWVTTDSEAGAGLPCEFPYGFGSHGSFSALSSPVESVVGSTETESDEEDYLAGLTWWMAHSTLQDNEKTYPLAFGSENPKTWVLAGSPQSTLCAFGGWSGCRARSSHGSPKGTSQVSSPPSTPMTGMDDAWEVLYAAAGQVARMKENGEGSRYLQGRGLLGPPGKPTQVAALVRNPNVGFSSNQAISHPQLQNNQFQHLKQQQLLRQECSGVWGRQAKVVGSVQPQQHYQQQQVLNRGRAAGYGSGRCARPLGLPLSAWPPLQQQQQQQQQAGSGMRAVFLEGGSGSRRESSGTGVFLPRRFGNQSESRKKPACSTVLLPARVVQALNLNLEDMGTHQRLNGGFTSEHVADAIMSRNRVVLTQQKQRNLGTPPAPAMNHEIRLPQEWTY